MDMHSKTLPRAPCSSVSLASLQGLFPATRNIRISALSGLTRCVRTTSQSAFAILAVLLRLDMALRGNATESQEH